MSWLFRSTKHDDLDDEIRSHLEIAARDRIERGESPDEARTQARRDFGNVVLLREVTRDVTGWSLIDRIGQDLRHALRRLRGQPSTAVLAVALLALAIGMSSAMFTVVDALILRPAPFRDPASFVWLGVGESDTRFNANLPLGLIKAWRSTPGLSGVYGVLQQPVTFGTGENAQVEAGARITPGLIEDLGVMPLVGRTFASGDGRRGEDEVAILSEVIWRTRFGSDPSIVGRRVEMSGSSVLIVGIMPGSFRFPFARTRVWRPLDLDQPPAFATRPGTTGYAYARLANGVPRPDIARAATTIAQAADAGTAVSSVQFGPIARNYLDEYSAASVRVLATGVGLVFLVLCANVTNLMLARLGARSREFALSSALGASRVRLLQQALFEQLVIGGSAGLIGLSLGAGLVAVAGAFLPTAILNGSLNPLDLDFRAVAATSALSGLAIAIAGVIPALVGTRDRRSGQLLQLSSRSATTERHTRRMTSMLLVGELALAVALSVAAGIQLRSFVNLLQEDRGIDVEHLATFEVTLPGGAVADGPSRYAVAEAIRSNAQSVPGIEAATLSRGVPPAAGALYFYDVVPDVPGAQPVKLVMNGYSVMPDFLRVYGIDLLEGRTFQPGDPPETAIVSRSMAAELWPGMAAVGRSMSFGKRSFRVVGVTSEIRNPMLDPRSDEPEMYEPLVPAGRDGAAAASLTGSRITVTVRCSAACPALDTVRARMKEASSAALVGTGKFVREAYDTALERPRTGTVIAIAFAGIALLAVGAGLFAVLTRVALQRQREFGIRIALGATPADLQRLVHSSSLAIGAIGIGAGAGLAWTLQRLLASVQYQVRLADPLTWSAVVAAIVLTTILAAWRPARQAMRVDPIALLREE
jgi:predicted permease